MNVLTGALVRYLRVRCESWQNRSLVSTVVHFPSLSPALAVGDPAATRTVYLTTIALVLLGIGLALLAGWLVRRTRPEPELFAPLEQMESRSWRKLDADERRARLDAVRPPAARPVAIEEFATERNQLDELGEHEVADDADRTEGAEEAEQDAATEARDDAAASPEMLPGEDAGDVTPTAGALPRTDGVELTGPDDPAIEVDAESPAEVRAESEPDIASHEDDPTVAIDRAPTN